MTLVAILIILASLTFLAYVTKRRFGVLGLALCAGLVLSQQISKDVANILRAADVPVEPLAYLSAASLFLILLPSLVLLVSGPKYTTQRSRIVGSIGYGVFAVLLLVGPLVSGLPYSDPAIAPMLTTIAVNTPMLLTAGIIAAIFDTFTSGPHKAASKKH